MSRFRKIDAATWSDEWFLSLSDDARLLWFYLLTGLEVTSVPGLISAGRSQLAENLGWPTDKFTTAFLRLGDRARADWEHRVVWLPNACRYNTPTNPNVVIGWREPLRLVRECELKVEACKVLLATCELLGQPYAVAFVKAVGERFLARARAAPAPASAPASEGVQGEDSPAGAADGEQTDGAGAALPWYAPQELSACGIPADATLPDDFRAVAAESAIVGVEEVFVKFKNDRLDKRIQSWNWLAAWRKWLVDEKKFQRRERERGSPQSNAQTHTAAAYKPFEGHK